jgi:hypothetical protein
VRKKYVGTHCKRPTMSDHDDFMFEGIGPQQMLNSICEKPMHAQDFFRNDVIAHVALCRQELSVDSSVCMSREPIGKKDTG